MLDRSFLNPGLLPIPGLTPIKVWLHHVVNQPQQPNTLLLETVDISAFLNTLSLEHEVQCSPYATILRGVFFENEDSIIEIHDSLGKTTEVVIPVEAKQYAKISKSLIWQVHQRGF